MALYLRRNSEGCFVAESEDGSIAGGLFCFVWGEVGWFGSLAVAPEWQGRGVAQRLTKAAVEYLRAKGCRRIGLETWPTLALTQHLYGKQGFVRCEPTYKLSRPVREGGVPALRASGTWDEAWTRGGDKEGLVRGMEAVREVAALAVADEGSAGAHADFADEVRVAVAGGFAELVVLRVPSGGARACALVYTRKPGGSVARALDVRLMLIASADADAAMDALLAALDQRAVQLGCRAVTCDVNVRFRRALEMVRGRGFRQIYELVRMELPVEGVDLRARSESLEFARWAG
jgi:ribosomal protein S18 acetylase RimI-like enzyme